MSWISRIFAKRVTAAPPSASVWTPRYHGINVTEDRALSVATVYRCVSLVSQQLAMLPWHTFKKTRDGNSQRIADSDAEWLLNMRASDEVPAFMFRRALVANGLIYGNGYAEIERAQGGKPYALHILRPQDVRPTRKPDGKLVYVVKSGGGAVELEPRDVLHYRATMAPDGITAMSPVAIANQVLGVAIALDDFAAAFFGNSMLPSMAISVPGKLIKEGKDALEGEFDRKFKGSKNAHKPIFLDGGMTVQELSFNNRDSQLVEQRQFQALEICRVFGVPPHLVFDHSRATWANIEHAGIEYVRDGLMPHVTALEQEVDIKILNSQRGGVYSKMNVNAFMRADSAARASYYQTMRNLGVLSANDILRLEDRDTIGPEGDVRVMQGQYVPLESITTKEADAEEVTAPATEPPQQQADIIAMQPRAKAGG